MRTCSPAFRARTSLRHALARSVLASACCALFVLSTVDAAEEHDNGGFEQHPAHEHGKVTLNIAIDRETLAVELDSPAANVIGFEHEPRTVVERNRVMAAASWIRKGDGIVRTPEDAACRFVRAEFQEPVFEHGAAADDDHDHEHDSERREQHGPHSDYEARFLYRCEKPARLTWLEPSILARLPNLREAQINLIGPSGQRSETVKDSRTRIPLR